MADAVCRREVPREHLLLVIRSFGGVAAWDGEGSPYSENHESITHQVSRHSDQDYHIYYSGRMCERG